MACTTEEAKNLGLSRCNELPGLMDGMIETNSDFVIPAATLASGAAAVQAYLEAALLDPIADRIFYWPPFKLVEDISVAPVYEDTPLAFIDVQKNKYRFRFSMSENLCLHKAIYTHYRKNGRVFLKDQNGFLLGTLLSNGDFAGLSIQLLNPEGFKFNDGSVSTKSPVVVALSQSIELNKNGYMFDASSFINELESIVDVNVTVVTITDAGDIDVLVATDCDQTGVTGLVAADFTYLNASGVAVTITSITAHASIPGQYKILQSGDLFVDGTINLKAPDVLSIQSYESLGAATVNIP